MIPTPTAELLLIMAALKEYTGDDIGACSRFMHGMKERIRSPMSRRRVVSLREIVPEIEVAQAVAEDALNALCFVCEKRMRCPRRLA